MRDEHSVTVGGRTVGFFGRRSSSLLLTWLASHRGRLHTLLLGGHRLSVLIVWDAKGSATCPERTPEEIAAMATVAFGPVQSTGHDPEERPECSSTS